MIDLPAGQVDCLVRLDCTACTRPGQTVLPHRLRQDLRRCGRDGSPVLPVQNLVQGPFGLAGGLVAFIAQGHQADQAVRLRGARGPRRCPGHRASCRRLPSSCRCPGLLQPAGCSPWRRHRPRGSTASSRGRRHATQAAGIGDVLAEGGQFGDPLAGVHVGDDDELPGLLVAARGGSPGGIDDLLDILPRQWACVWKARTLRRFSIASNRSIGSPSSLRNPTLAQRIIRPQAAIVSCPPAGKGRSSGSRPGRKKDPAGVVALPGPFRRSLFRNERMERRHRPRLTRTVAPTGVDVPGTHPAWA